MEYLIHTGITITFLPFGFNFKYDFDVDYLIRSDFRAFHKTGVVTIDLKKWDRFNCNQYIKILIAKKVL